MNTWKTFLVLLAIVPLCLCEKEIDYTSCLRHREREMNSKNLVPGRVIPECDENGEYKNKQCFGEATKGPSFCSCWAPNGDIITSPSRTLKSCKCHVSSHLAMKNREDYIPRCERNGDYKSKQCNKKTQECWCSDSKGAKISSVSSSSTCAYVP